MSVTKVDLGLQVLYCWRSSSLPTQAPRQLVALAVLRRRICTLHSSFEPIFAAI